MTIHVENISKRFFIRHENAPQYSTLRDTLANGFKSIFLRMRNQSPSEHQSIEPFWALKDVSFDVEPGDRVAIIGRNGAGKSTLLKVLSRISPPTSGHAIIKGKVASLLEVGTGFHPELTGAENIYLNGALLGMTKQEIKRKFDEIVEFADIEKFLDTPVKHYSSGMYVRLAFGVAAHLEPEIMFIDEVLAVGDARFQKKCIGKMEEVAKNGRTILFITHNMGSLGFCNKGILLEKGRLIPTQTLEDCIQRYNEEILMTGSQQSWEGDIGDEKVRIKHLSIAPTQKNGFFSKAGQAKVEVVFDVQKQIRDLVLGYLVFNKNGVNLVQYKASHEDQIPILLEPGSYRMESLIDVDIFSEGFFRLELDMSIHGHKRIGSSDAHVNFQVINSQKKYGEPENTIFPEWHSTIEKISTVDDSSTHLKHF